MREADSHWDNLNIKLAEKDIYIYIYIPVKKYSYDILEAGKHIFTGGTEATVDIIPIRVTCSYKDELLFKHFWYHLNT